jgi:hypothetical protein
MLHAFAQQGIPQRARDDHHENRQKSFELQWFLRRHAFPAVKQKLANLAIDCTSCIAAQTELRACLVYNYRLVKFFTFPEVLLLCVALLALPRKAGVAILIGFAQPLRPLLIADQTSREFSPPACAPSAPPG